MTRARTYTKAEIADAAEAAAVNGLRVIMHPTGEIEFAPKSFPSAEIRNGADDALEKFLNAREARRSAHGQR